MGASAAAYAGVQWESAMRLPRGAGFRLPRGVAVKLRDRLRQLRIDAALRARPGSGSRRSYQARYRLERMTAKVKEDVRRMIDVVLLHWNHEASTLQTARKLLAAVGLPLRILVVDNGSEAGSIGALWQGLQALDDRATRLERSAIPRAAPGPTSRVVLIENGSNLGFAGGVNQGLTLSLQQRHSKYVLVLNSDVDFVDDFVSHLVEAAEADDAVGAVGGLILWRTPGASGGQEYVWYGGGSISWLSSAGYRVVSGPYDQVSRLAETPRRVDFITGAMLLLRASAIHQVGLLDDRFFFGGEDSDLSIRLARAGYELHYTPKARIWHESTKRKYDPAHLRRIEYIYGSRALLWRKHRGPLPATMLTLGLWAYALTAYPFRVWLHAHRAGASLPPGDVRCAAIRSLRRFGFARRGDTGAATPFRKRVVPRGGGAPDSSVDRDLT